MDHDEAQQLRESVRRLCADAGDDAWRQVVAAGLLEVLEPDSGGVAAVLVIMAEFGRAALDLPYMEGVIAASLWPALGREPVALVCAGIEGSAPAVTIADRHMAGRVRGVEHVERCARIVVLTPTAAAACRVDAAGLRVQQQAALTLAPLADLDFDQVAAEALVAIAPGRAAGLESLLRLGRAARACGAARQGFELAVEHAKTRQQFGQPIGRFQALQHKLADCAIVLDAAELQLAAAAAALDASDAGADQAVAAALAFCTAELRRVQLEVMHALGAIGHAEEHVVTRHFRRMHADLCSHGGVRRARAALAALALDGSRDLFAASGDDAAAAVFRAELRAWLDINWNSDERAANKRLPLHERSWNLEFARRLGRAGHTTLTWPHAHGGQQRSSLEQLAYVEEMLRADAPDLSTIVASWILGPELLVHGSPELQAELLPLIRAGEASFCLGYSEPEAGSDLASLRTRAVRDGDGYVIDGQKIWTTDGQRATHMILAARTHPDPARRHNGVSLFLMRMDAPGVSVRPSMALYGYPFCTVFLDGVRVPVTARLGEEHAGWPILGGALASERVVMGGFVSRIAKVLERIVRAVAASPLRDDVAVRERIGALCAEVEAARRLVLRPLRMHGDAGAQMVAAAMSKVYSSMLGERLAETALEIFGSEALLADSAPDVPADGAIEQLLRRSIMMVVGGGTNEIQRTLIAQRGLGLPR